MATVINMPRLSDTMEEGVVAKWLKSVGDKIEEGDILAEIETDKATMEFESFHEGTLLYIGIQEGETSPVDVLLAIVGEEDEDISALISGKSGADKKETEEAETEEEKTTSETSDSGEIKIPEGVQVVTMPRLSDTMTDGTVAAWLKKVGDKVEEGDILAEIETDKATMEFECFYEGTILHIGVQEGETAPVDSLLTIIGPKGTDVSAIVANGGVTASESSDETTDTAKKEEKKEEPKEEKVAEETNATATTTTTSGGRIFASPLAKKIAADKGFNLGDIAGSGENGRIIKKDVENYTPAAKPVEVAQETKAAPAAAPAMSFVATGEEKSEEVKNSQMRKAIAKSLGNSKFSAPDFSLNIEVDMDSAMASRKTINAIPDVKVSFNDMVVKACAMALQKHPQVNTSWTDTATIYHSHIHVGVAVAVDDGLLVPVVKHTNQMSLTQIGATVRDLAGKARHKKISPAEMQGSTFTVSNLGMFGIDNFTSIINQPNSAILSVGAIVEKPVVRNGQIVVGNTMKLTLTCDHRTVDGAVGAQFLQTLKTFIENPVTMLA
ncbi:MULTISPECIES: pyruvate dehydrogenase complex dihydrolipoamide acetyltransferase [unclassified Polaribacter]|uniref:pyruvate dehydrogenase complex dihydrolipoamide acetyltransferase n=1 Tax=unclassified Polaribacter TaxID=196858 RepID=UPI0011BFB70F|nr:MULTISPECIES: pyruvate dehydrogenase complex dihydrolipoamide acetyltransferase [unclassified Polaribacter]TXD51079.1 pyruvate dehydrogenase complex dihydrolipoamide acetyltransferase [Polaribacter sp. IC063]TXD57960.1 pyruvate dehydrogenase complex dihydrolipoamide acetyltransferase [Polaribacter sp. IC066]